MRAALKVLNQLVATGVIPLYAIGGAIGASFYIEAQATEDLDIFVALPQSTGGLLSRSPIYAACVAQGGVIEGEYVRLGAWPVQILPAYKPLVEEALNAAIEVSFDGIPTRVFTAEHLCAIAIAIDTGRPKDYLRVSMFLEQDGVDVALLDELLCRYQLEDRRRNILNWPAGDGNANEPQSS